MIRLAAHPRRPAATLLVLVLGVGLTACSSSGSSGAAKDVSITSCARDAGSHKAVAKGEVKNSSSKKSNYVIQIDVKANDSKLEAGFASVLNVGAGETKAFSISATGADVPSGTTVTCPISRVVRTVSP